MRKSLFVLFVCAFVSAVACSSSQTEQLDLGEDVTAIEVTETEVSDVTFESEIIDSHDSTEELYVSDEVSDSSDLDGWTDCIFDLEEEVEITAEVVEEIQPEVDISVPCESWQQYIAGAGTQYAFAGTPTADGGYIMAGEVDPVAGDNYDLLLVKLYADGGIEWSQQHSEVGSEWARDVVEIPDGGYFAIGGRDATASGSYDGMIWRLDSAGEIVWAKDFGDENLNVLLAASAPTKEGVVAVGYSLSSETNSQDYWVIKVDYDGEVIWSHVFGSDANEQFNAIENDADKSYIAAGMIFDKLTGKETAQIIKLNSEGEIVWDLKIADGLKRNPLSIMRTVAGGYIGAGYAHDDDGMSWQGWIFRVKPSGALDWQQSFGGFGLDLFTSILETPEGEFVAFGDTWSSGEGQGDAWLVKLYPNGWEEVWEKTFGDAYLNDAEDIGLTKDGGYFLVYNTYPGGDWSDILAVKLDSDGEFCE